MLTSVIMGALVTVAALALAVNLLSSFTLKGEPAKPQGTLAWIVTSARAEVTIHDQLVYEPEESPGLSPAGS